ncbi:MAG TPA: hypothetical protein PKE44_18360, partial [Plasticicumulans sp.]|uniref:hypothetical protein n=1 Tax=Plasticicumulans sp. TaxID=2307179 RepID=UPI002BBD0BF3
RQGRAFYESDRFRQAPESLNPDWLISLLRATARVLFPAPGGKERRILLSAISPSSPPPAGETKISGSLA